MRDAPLAEAFVTLAGSTSALRSALSDDHGVFHFDSVAPGSYTIALQHAAFDALGLSGTAMRVIVTDGRDTVRLSSPSFANLWRFECSGALPLGDTGFVFGTIRSATTRKPAVGAAVTIRWTDLALDKKTGVVERPWRFDGVADSTGEFRICRVPSAVVLQARAVATGPHADTASSGVIDLVPNGYRVRRLDLVVGDARDASVGRTSVRRGVVTGFVTTEAGAPVQSASVVAEDSLGARTDSSGRFVLRDVSTGTQQLEAHLVGMSPVFAVADVYPGDTARVTITMAPVAMLAPVNVRSTHTVQQMLAREFDERRSLGFGHFRDSTELAKHVTMSSVFEEMPGVIVQGSGAFGLGTITFPDLKRTGRCTPNVWIDGILADASQLVAALPSDFAAVEVYTHPLDTPGRFIVRDPQTQTLCGSIVIWTKRAFP